MKCERTSIQAEVFPYEIGAGLEDGFELLMDVVTKSWVYTDNLVKITKEDGKIVCPYVLHRRGKTFIAENDYIIVDEDGTKHVCGADKIWSRYKKLED